MVMAAAAFVVLAVVFVLFPSLTLRSKGAVRGTVSPAERGIYGLGQRLSEAMDAIRGIGGAAEENRELSLQLVRIQTELSRLRDAEADNVRLRRAFGFYLEQKQEMIPCNVVSRNISGWWNSVRLGKGSKDGIEPGLAVISPEGIVGKTTEVASHTAEVLLISDPACQLSATIKSGGREVFGLVHGTGGNIKGEPRARIEFINKDIAIQENDEVVTSGLGSFPKGVHIGYVEKVYQDDSGLFQYADIIPRATTGLLDYVFVVLPPTREGAE